MSITEHTNPTRTITGWRRPCAVGLLGGVAGGVAAVAAASVLGFGSSQATPRRDITPLEDRLSIVGDGAGGRYAAVDFELRLRRLVFSNFSDQPEPVLLAQYRTQPERLQERSVVVVPPGDTVVLEGQFIPREINGVRTSGLFHRVLMTPGVLGRTMFVSGITTDGLVHEVVAFVGD